MIKVNKQLVSDAIKYSNLNGIAGHEEKVAQAIKEDLKDIKGLEFERDGLGSIAVIKKSAKKDAPTISFSTHIDEVGFMINNIDSKGFITFTSIGGWWGHVVLAQKLTITTREGKEFIGVVGSTPPHLLDASMRKNVLPVSKMFIDIGVNSKEEVLNLGIQVGDMITPYQNTAFQTPNENRIIGKAFDNRISIVAGIEMMKQLADKELDVNVILIGTTQEEVGLRGARTSSYKWTADVAFAIDVTFCYNTPGMKDSDTKLGSGVALSLFDATIIGNPKMIASVEEIVKSNKMPYTYDSITGGGTDSGTIHLTKEGIPTMTLSIPSRYMHSHVSMIDLQDVQTTANLMTKYVENFTNETLERIKYK